MTIAATLWVALQAGVLAEEPPATVSGTVWLDKEYLTPLMGWFYNGTEFVEQPATYLVDPVYDVTWTYETGNPLTHGGTSFSGHASHQLWRFTVSGGVTGKRKYLGNPVGHWEATPYFRATRELDCSGAACAPNFDVPVYARFGTVKGEVLLPDGTPAPGAHTIYAAPIDPIPPGGEGMFAGRTAVATGGTPYRFHWGSFMPAQGGFPNAYCFSPYNHECTPIPVPAEYNWGLPVLGDGAHWGPGYANVNLYYSNGPGQFTWEISLGEQKQNVVVKSDEETTLNFTVQPPDPREYPPAPPGPVPTPHPPPPPPTVAPPPGGGTVTGGGAGGGPGRGNSGPGGSPERSGGPNAGRAAGAPPESTGDTCPVPHPVDVTTGKVFLDHVDAVVPGLRNDLVFARHYSSLSASYGGILGQGWTHTYSKRIMAASQYVLMLWDNDGSAAMYTDPDRNGVLTRYMTSMQYDTITRSGDEYVRTFENGGVERYRSDGRLSARVDRIGRTTSLVYDTEGKLTEIQSPEGKVLKLEYRGAQVSRLLGPQGVIAEYSYSFDPATRVDRLSRVRYTDGTGYTFTYDDAHRLLTATNLAGVVFDRHAYAADGKPIWTELNAGQERYEYAFEAGRATVTDARGAVTITEWTDTPVGPRMTRVSGCGYCGNVSGTRTWDHDVHGRVSKYTDSENHETVFSYDGPRLVSITNALNQTTTFGGHDEYGRISTITKPGWGTTTLTYAPEGVATVTLPGGQTTTYTYDNGKLASVRSPGGLVTQYEVNDLGQLLSVTDPRGKRTTYTYDGREKVKTVTAPDGAMTTIGRDSQGRVVSVTRPDGKATKYGYDASGRIESATDEAGRVRRYTYDAFGRLETEADPIGGVTRMTYDSLSNLASITDAKGQRTSYSHDDLGRVTRMTDPMGGFEEYEYHTSGLLKAKVDRRGVRTEYGYDALGRLTSKTYSDGTPSASVTFDDAARRVTTANGADTLTWQYDASGRLTSEQSSRNGSTAAYTYDDDHQRLSASLDGTPTAQYGYELGLPKWIQSGPGRFEFGYDDLGRRISLTRPNGVTTTYSFEPLLGWLSSIEDKAGGTLVSSVSYSHDTVGNRLTKVTADWAETYSYDPLSRLTAAKRETGGATTGDWSFGYDAVGNRLTERVSGASRTYSHDARNRLLGVQPGGTLKVAGSTNEVANVKVDGQPATALPGKAFEKEIAAPGGTRTFAVEATDPSGNIRTNTYEASATSGSATLTHDENGNLTGKVDGSGAWVYEWNAENQLNRVSRDGSEVARFEYDPAGRRVRKVAGGLTHAYTYDGEDILRETRSEGATTTTYTYLHGPGIDEPLARVDQAGTAAFYHADGLGSIVKLTDSAGQVVASYDYDAWGNLMPGSATPDPFAFTGREWDPETESYYYRARYYDPTWGRFLSEDPIRFGAFTYVGNEPVRRADPTGLVIVERGPTTPHMEPSGIVVPHCDGHLGCVDTLGDIMLRCYEKCGSWRVEFTIKMSIDMWVSSDLGWKTPIIEAHERGHVAISEKWFEQVVADARTMESYGFGSREECYRKAALFRNVWILKRNLRQFFYEVWD